MMLRDGTIPHCLLFTGPSGTGKTTLSRILRRRLGCSDQDFVEINAADDRGIDMIREIKSRMGLAPLIGKCRIWLIDECHAMTAAAQDSFLKIIEDTPKHVYFMLCTTDPKKLKPMIVTRCTEVRCKAVGVQDLMKLVDRVSTAEGLSVEPDVSRRIADVADGSPRKALVLLHAVIGIKDSEQQIAAIDSNDTKGQAFDIARALLNPKTTWSTMAGILSKVDEEPESLRYMVLGYANAILLKGKDDPRAIHVIAEFMDNFYDSKKAGLIFACYNVIKG
jgi:DNA polymerase-3 subunit gamma/tau